MKYALIKDGTLDRTREWGDETPPDLSHKIGVTLEWLPCVNETPPAYDENTQRLQKTTTIQATEVTYGWSVVPLSKESIKEKVDELSAEKVQEQLGDITSRLATMTKATMLLDAVNQGIIQNDNAALTPLRDLGTWWQATQDYAESLKTDIDADLTPDITVGWPTI